EGMVNLPLFGGRGAVRAVAWREQAGGYIDDAGLGLTNVNRTVRLGGRLAASVELNDRWSLSAGIVGQAIDSADTQYALAGEPPYTRRNSLREPHDNDFAEINASLRGDLGWARLNWSTAFVDHRLDSRYDATIAPPVPMPPGPAAFDDENGIVSVVTEATLLSPAEARVGWLAGLFYARARQDVTLSLARPGAGGPPALNENRRDRLDEIAAFGEVTLPLADRLELTLGGRLFNVAGRTSSRIAASPGAVSIYQGSSRQTGLAPKILLAWRPSSTRLWYLTAAEGYRAGGINTTGAPGQPFSAPGGPQPWRRYQGDELWSFEAGGRFQWLDGRLQMTVAAFEARWSNIQSDQLLPNGLPFTANIGDGVNLGIEVEGVYRAGALVLTGNALFNAPELDRANAGFTSRGDLALAAVPELSGGLSAHYAWPLAGERLFALDARLAYVGRSTLTFDAATSPDMGDYLDGRLAGSLVTDHWTLTLAVTNPADSRGDTFAYGNPFTLKGARQMTPLRPVTAEITVRASF
ncbi:MAG TPA: TonB-dependent receptor, partial [Caulobacter sp.]|nr:TonB-dependent receptor [Caulobacter sp.]